MDVKWGLVAAVRGCRGDEVFVLQLESCSILPGASVCFELSNWLEIFSEEQRTSKNT